MNDQLPAKPGGPTSRVNHKDIRPALGSYHWVKCTETRGKKKIEVEELMCVYHLASNHVEFRQASDHGGSSIMQVRYRDLLKETRPEPNPKAVLEQKIEAKRIELSAAVRLLADAVKGADLIPDPDAEQTLLPSVTRRDPGETKKALIRLKEKDLPQIHKTIEQITREITALHRDQCMPMFAETERMKNATGGIEQRLFALELYAGLWQEIKQIGEGEPPAPETPIVVRQLLRYMDEETLFDWKYGGMDYSKLSHFDKWISKPENRDRILPEPRCIVAFQVRRNPKDYGRPLSIAHAFAQMEEHMANMKTYLVMRNGGQMFRLATDIEFSPRLLPFKEEFVKPFTETEHRSNFGDVPFGKSKSWTEEVEVTPDDLNYDRHVQGRLAQIFKYNRVMFLVQGLLDRSKVFKPHPPINLADPDHIAAFFKPLFDEETGLPSSHPPKWSDYQDKANASIKPGTWVCCDEREEDREIWNRFGKWKKAKHDVQRPTICRVKSISRDRKKVTFRWAMGDRIKEEWVIDKTRPVPNRPGYYYQKRLEHNLGMRFGIQVCDIENCFNVEAYKLGDYKQFLCDAYLKGAYLQWAPLLLRAEQWHQERNQPIQSKP